MLTGNLCEQYRTAGERIEAASDDVRNDTRCRSVLNWHNIRYMPDDGFAEIQRKLETIASELKTATDSAQRRELLRVMSRLVVEADSCQQKCSILNTLRKLPER